MSDIFETENLIDIINLLFDEYCNDLLNKNNRINRQKIYSDYIDKLTELKIQIKYCSNKNDKKILESQKQNLIQSIIEYYDRYKFINLETIEDKLLQLLKNKHAYQINYRSSKTNCLEKSIINAWSIINNSLTAFKFNENKLHLILDMKTQVFEIEMTFNYFGKINFGCIELKDNSINLQKDILDSNFNIYFNRNIKKWTCDLFTNESLDELLHQLFKSNCKYKVKRKILDI